MNLIDLFWIIGLIAWLTWAQAKRDIRRAKHIMERMQ